MFVCHEIFAPIRRHQGISSSDGFRLLFFFLKYVLDLDSFPGNDGGKEGFGGAYVEGEVSIMNVW